MTSKSLVFVGGFGNSIMTFELDFNGNDLHSSRLVLKERVEKVEKPAFLHILNDNLYCVNEVQKFQGEKSGGLSLFKILESGTLNFVQSQFSCGEDPTHLTINAEKECLYVANYSSGHFVVPKFSKDGKLGGALYIESFESGSNVDKVRQDASHPHGVYLKDQFVYVVDLGADKIWHYSHGEEFTTSEIAFTCTPPGSGPRHMVFHPKLDLAFLLTELTNNVIVYKYDKKTGGLGFLASYSCLSESKIPSDSYASEIVLHPNNNFVYTSIRHIDPSGKGAIISYRIVDSSGKLEKIESFAIYGSWPRHFAIHSSGKLLLCADQFSDSLELLAINEETGKLEHLNVIECKNKPSCVIIKEL